MKAPDRRVFWWVSALMALVMVLPMIGWTLLRQGPRAVGESRLDSSQALRPQDSRASARMEARVSGQTGDVPGRVGDAATGSGGGNSGLVRLRPSQVQGQVFPKPDLDALALRLPADQYEVYERMRMEFPDLDWTEIESTHQAFLAKRSRFPLNPDDGQREAYAAWLGETGPTAQALVRLHAEELGLSAGGMEDGHGYYIDGFRDGVPVYVVTANVGAAETTGVKYVRWNPGFDPALGDTVNGGEFYVNVNDHGEIYEHAEFQLPNAGGSRIMVKEVPGYADGNRNHMTHVAGTMTAWGYNSSLQGMAPRAWIRALIQQSTWHITTYGMATPGQQMAELNPRTGNPQLRSVVGNTSLGTTDPYNRYDSSSASYDSVLRDYPYYMHFNSTGNSGSGYETLTGGWKIAKNMIGIGNATAATRDANGVYTGGGNISSSSSRGPTYDGRINPDFVAKGSSVYSTVDTAGAAYYSGTSMSSPNSAGSVALLMDYVRQRMPQQYLRSPTYRALLMSTADDRGNPGPDYIYGWGILNIHAAGKILRQQAENSSLRLVIEDSLASTKTWTETYVSDGTKPIRVSIAWLDPAGPAAADGDRSPRLVNDLDLRILGPGGTVHLPYVMPFTTGQGATPAYDASLYGANAVAGDNITDSVEQVYVAAPPAGTYTIQVSHKRTLSGNQAQLFSVAVSGLTNAFGVFPSESFSAAGPQGGPFTPDTKTYTITNNGVEPLAWSVAANPAASWLTLSPAGGTIAGGSSTTFTAGFNANANALAAGTHTTDLVITAGGATASRQVSLLVRPMSGFAWDTVPSPRYRQTPFSVNIRAVDSTGATVRAFAGAAALTVPSAGAGPVQVGTGTGTWAYPLKAANHDARTQTIYLSSNLGSANRFSGLALDIAGAPGQTLDNFTIRMKHTATSKYNNDNQAVWESTGWTTVFQQNVTLNSTGWVEFPFSTPFDYNGTDNVIVDFSFNNASGSSDGTVRMTSTGSNNQSIVFASDSANGDPLTWSARTPAGVRSTTIPNVKLLAPGGITITPTTTANFASGVWTGLVTVNEAAASVTLRATSGGLSGDSNAFAVEAKSVPSVTTWPTASSIAYGQPASASVLSGGSASVDGSFSFANPGAILQAGAHSVAVVFNPTDSANYGTVDGIVSLVVTQAVPVVSAWPTASSITYGQALGASLLSGGSASTAGGFTFVTPATTPDAGSYNAAIRFTPNDATNYTVVDGSVTVSVAKQTPVVTAWPTAGALAYGQSLSSSALSGGAASVAGTFAFDAPATAPNAGNYSAAVTFTPTQTANYHTVGGNVTVAVSKAVPIVHTWPSAGPIEYGQVVADSVLSGGSASVPGVFVFAEAGSGFTGSDSFTFKVNDGTVDSAPATVTISGGGLGQSEAEAPADPQSDAAIDSTQTTADRITDIYVTCDNGYELYVNGALLGTGNNWNAAQRYQNTPLQVGRNVVAIKGTDAGGIAALLAEMVIDGQRIGSGTSWKCSLTAPADWKDAGFDDSAWVPATDYGAYGISPWNKNASGMPSDSPGRWIWSSNSDLHDTVYFRYVIDVMSPNSPPVANAQSVTVERNTPKPVTLTASDPDNDPLTYAIVNPPSYGSLSGTAPDLTYTPPSMLDPGVHAVAVIFIPTDEVNYQTVSNTVELEVLQGSSVVVTEWPAASPIIYGQAISASTLAGGSAPVPGSFAFSAPDTMLNAGTHSVAVIFTPTDTETYNPVAGSVQVVVGKATPVITAWPAASAIHFGQYLSASTLDGGAASVAGGFSFDDPDLLVDGHDSFTFRVSDGSVWSSPATVAINGGLPAGGVDAGISGEPASTRADGYTVVTFTESGEWTVPGGVSSVEVLVVGGGGGGAGFNKNWGGGGAGGFISSSSYSVTSGASMAVTVGAGGTGGSPSADNAADGGLSRFGQLIAYGGKAGRDVGGNSGGNSADGGATINPGYTGGITGGSGAGAGQNGANNWFSGGQGGAGRQSSIVDGTTAVYYGGGGGLTYGSALGGLGGGGNGSTGAGNGSPGVNGLGGGGGASRQGTGGNGGSGVVIVAYLVTNLPPVANAQGVTVEPGVSTAITLTGSDPDGDPLTFEIVTPPVHGSLVGTAPDLTYNPAPLPAVGTHDVTVTFTPDDTANYHSVTGAVSVTVGGGVSIYQNWAGQYTGHDLSDASGDNDGDGLSNFHEFAFGLDPTSGSSSNPIVAPFDKASRSFSYTRRAGSGLAYTVCVSPDLREWQDLPPAQVAESVVESAEAGAETVTVTLSSLPDTGNLFLRVRAD